MIACDCEYDMPTRLLLLLLLWSPLHGFSATTVLVLGDSLSAAHGIDQKQGWVTLLERRLHRQCADCRVINASISGETTAGGRSRILPLLKHYHPEILILELGGNDGLRGLPIAEMYGNLDHIITRSLQRDVKVLLLGMRLPPNYGPAYTHNFQNVYKRLADKYRLDWVPFLLAGLEDRRDLFQADGIHPVAAAQPIMLDNVWPVLQSLLPEQPGNPASAAGEIQPAMHHRP
jgi:acyl-CoA thioesterase-1